MDPVEAWALFDRDVTTQWTPSAGSRDVRVELDAPIDVAALKVHGEGAVSIRGIDAEALSEAHPSTPDAWTTRTASRIFTLDAFTLDVGDGAAIGEIELWALDEALPVAWEPAREIGAAVPTALADTTAASPAAYELEPTDSTAPPCAVFSFDVARHPGAFRRAWLRYRTIGAFRSFVLTRAVNTGPMLRGHAVTGAGGERVFVDRIDPELLRYGANEAHFCLPDSSVSGVTVADVELVAEFDDGSNFIDSVTVAPVDGMPTDDRATLDADEEIVVSFERLIAVDAMQLGDTSGVDWSARCVAADGLASPLTLTTIDVDHAPALASQQSVSGGPARGCAGLRLRPSAATEVTALRVFGSGASRRIDFPQIVLSSPPEHFGLQAWVDGWARARSDVGGLSLVAIDDEPTGSASGAYGAMRTRARDPEADWPVAVQARFADGTSVTRNFVLVRSSEVFDGASSTETVVDDGLTVEERRRRFGEPGQTVTGDVRPGEAAHIALGTDVSVDLPRGAASRAQTISITHLGASEVPPLDPGMINVTAPAAHGYEFLPHGETFDDAVVVTIPYQPSLLPAGYVPEDVNTFFYDTTERRWVALARDRVDRARQVARALTDHFTTMIDSVVVAPEHPQVANFDPNRMRGVEAATASAQVSTIAPPEPNARGTAALSYPFELPPGRAGMAPSLALTYDSERGNGWLGVGWDVGVPSVSIDTRWGVPRYDAGIETETYVIGGEQLAPAAHRSAPTARTGAERTFRMRVEGSFARIVRRGTGPTNYSWEVTDKNGGRWLYGTDASSRLADDTGNVFRWALREMRDLHGNIVRFDYETVTFGAGRGQYLSAIHYTLRDGESSAPYEVRLLREGACETDAEAGCRRDVIINARGGFQEVTSQRLNRVEVYFRSTLVRAWDLAYDHGPFGKSRLRSLTQFGVGNVPFPGNVHTFDYYDDISVTGGSGDYAGFAPAVSELVGGDDPDVALSIPAALAPAVGQAATSMLGGTRSESAGIHFYAGFNPTFPLKENSFGVKVGGRVTESSGVVALIDIDGDGLADRVLSRDGRYVFNRNLYGPGGVGGFEDIERPIDGLSALSRERSVLFSIGAEVYPGPAQIQANAAFTLTTQSAYFSDVNSDGLVDFVNGGSIAFNRLNAENLPVFAVDNGLGTPFPLGTSSVSGAILPDTFVPSGVDLGERTPPLDSIRRWTAPFAGTIRVSGEARLVAAQPEGGDGVRVSIERGGAFLWSETLGPTSLVPRSHSLSLDVAAGDVIWFRVHSGADPQGDRVSWQPIVAYESIPSALDANGLDVRRFDSADDFALAGRGGVGVRLPYDGTVHVAGSVVVDRPLNDDLHLGLAAGTRRLFDHVLPSGEAGPVPVLLDFAVSANEYLTFRLDADSPIDASAVSMPAGLVVTYRSASDESGTAVATVDDAGQPILTTFVPPDLTTFSRQRPAIPAQAFVPPRSGTIRVGFQVSNMSATGHAVIFTAKSRGALAAKSTLDAAGFSSEVGTLDLEVQRDMPVFFSFSVGNPTGFSDISAIATFAYVPAAMPPLPGESGTLPTLIYGRTQTSRYSEAYRGWSYGVYDSGAGRGALPIDEARVSASVPFDEDDGATEANAGRFRTADPDRYAMEPVWTPRPCAFAADSPLACSPMDRVAHWRGPDERVYITASEVSASRLGSAGRAVDIPGGGALGGAAAVPRVSRSTSLSAGAGVGPLSASVATGGGEEQLDFFDLNGDGFPDVVTPDGAQFTTARGALAESRSFGVRAVRASSQTSFTAGLGGNIADAQLDARAQAGTSAGGRNAGGSASGSQMPTLGIAVSANAGGGVSASDADYLDINGDGLPDRVSQSGALVRVELNVGYDSETRYRFAAPLFWGEGTLHRGYSAELNGGPSISFNDGVYGFAGGVTAGLSTSTVTPVVFGDAIEDVLGVGATLLDINGDGLLDRVRPVGGGFEVHINLGHRFETRARLWRGRIADADAQETRSTEVSGGIYFTVGIPLCLAACYLILNPGADASQSVSRPVGLIRDIDGDGYPDHLSSTTANGIAVAKNLHRRTDLLSHFRRPLGAEVWLDYERAGNTQPMPGSRWVLSSIKTFDGQSDSAELGVATDHTLTRIAYEGGVYDRAERELYGFGRVLTSDVDTRGWSGLTPSDGLGVLRFTDRRFHTESYAERGLAAETAFFDGAGRVFSRSRFAYELRDAETGDTLTRDDARSAAAVFPALVRTEKFAHEGNETESIRTVMTQDYDLLGNVVRLVDAGGDGSSDDYIAVLGYTSRMAACRTSHVVGIADDIAVTDLAGTVLRHRASTVDCASGEVRQVETTLDGSTSATTDLEYDADGNLTAVTGPANRAGQRYRLDYTYEPDTRTHVASVVDSFGYVSSAEYDLRFGAARREVDLNDQAVETEYDAFGRIAQILGPHELAIHAPYTLHYSYAPDAEVPYAFTQQIDVHRGLADPIEATTFIDGLGRVLQTKQDTTVHRGDEPDAQDVQSASGRALYDPWGRVVAMWHPTETALEDHTTFDRLEDATAEPTRITYDALDRVTSTVAPDASTTTQAYALTASGATLWALSTTTDAEGQLRDTLRDARGRIRRVVEHNAGHAINTRYEYDPLDQLREVVDAAGNVIRSDYDTGGRRTDITTPDTGRTHVEYDAAGNLARRITANLRATGGSIEYHYDFTHLVAIDYPTHDENDVQYAWGASDAHIGNRVGRITRVDDAAGSTERTYGPLGEIVREDRTIVGPRGGDGPRSYSTSFLYDTWGRLQQVVYPDAEVLTYAYDSGGRVSKAEGVKLGERFEYVNRLEYDRFGQRVFMQAGNGVRTHYEYDPADRRLALLEAGDFQRYVYNYDSVGNVKTLTNDVMTTRDDRFGGRVDHTYTYDALHRLTTAQGDWQTRTGKREHYELGLTYSDIHTLEHKTQEHTSRNRGTGPEIVQRRTSYDQAYAYGTGPHAPSRIGADDYGYDLDGNTTLVADSRSGRRRTMVWDEEDRLASVSDNGHTTDFVYDHAGQRTSKVGAAGETVYVSPLFTVRNGAIGTKHIFVGTDRIASKLSPGAAHLTPGGDDPVATMLGRWWLHRSDSGFVHARNVEMNPHYRVPSTTPPGGTPETHFLYFYHTDHLGSASYVTDTDGDLYEHVQYFPSGEVWVDERRNTERLPYLFTGKELDQETGLTYFGARYYDPRAGCWLSGDPLLSEDSDVARKSVYSPVSLSAYAYAENNPILLSDPDGQIVSFGRGWSDIQKATILSRMQRLTDQRLIIRGDHIEIDGGSRGAHPRGTALVRRMIQSDHTLTIVPTTGETRVIPDDPDRARRPRVGTDSTLYLNLDESAQTLVEGPRGMAVLEVQPAQIGMGHEISHADRNARGRTAPNRQAIVVYRTQFRRRDDVTTLDEAEVTGLRCRDCRGGTGTVSENDLRREQGAPRRVAYRFSAGPTPE